MGFGSVAAQLIMFISLMSITTTVVLVFDQHTQETATAMVVKTDALANSLKTNFVISSVSHNSSSNITSIYLVNTGDTELNTNMTDVILDGEFVPRNVNKNISVIASTQVRNPLLWDPNEVLSINVTKVLTANTTHIIDVISEYGVRETDTFSFS